MVFGNGWLMASRLLAGDREPYDVATKTTFNNVQRKLVRSC